MVGGSSDRHIRSYCQGAIDGRKATNNGKGSERVVLLGDAGTWDERSRDIEKTEHRVLDGERICDERTANHRGARMEAFGRGQIREYEERPLIPREYEERPLIPLFKLHQLPTNRWSRPRTSAAQLIVIEDAARPRQSLRMIIRRLLGALRLTTSGFSSQSRSQASLPPVLLLIRSDSAETLNFP